MKFSNEYSQISSQLNNCELGKIFSLPKKDRAKALQKKCWIAVRKRQYTVSKRPSLKTCREFLQGVDY